MARKKNPNIEKKILWGIRVSESTAQEILEYGSILKQSGIIEKNEPYSILRYLVNRSVISLRNRYPDIAQKYAKNKPTIPAES